MAPLSRYLLFPLLLFVLASDASAIEAVAKRKTTIRKDPSTKHAPISILLEGEEVELVEPAPRKDYLHVRTPDGDEGWVYAHNMEIVAPGAGVVAAPTGAAPAEPAGSPVHAGVVSKIDPSWDKPEPNTTTYDGPDGHCGPTGDGGDAITNKRKNRTDLPSQYHEVTWKALQAMPYPAAAKSLENWTPAEIKQIQPYQGVPVSVVGYMTAIKVQDHGSGESTNCHFTNAEEVDWHVPLVEHPGYQEATSIVVETTPRVRKTHPKWTPSNLAPWVNSSAPVRISGWTMMDPEHRAHLGKYRSTLWEVHPITKIEVFKDGRWVDVDDL
jgi:hypothetical protein